MKHVILLAGSFGLAACDGGIDEATSDAGSHDANVATNADSGHAIGTDAGMADGSSSTSTPDAGTDNGSSVDAAGIPEMADCLASPYEMRDPNRF